MAWYNYLSVEIPLLFCTFGYSLQGHIITNLYIYRTCYGILGYNESDCSQLGNEDNNITHSLEPKVQPTVNKMKMVHSVIHTLLPLIFSLFVGTWSDKFGRKPIMILCFAGMILSTAMETVIIHFSNLSPWWFILSSVPSSLTGGFSSLSIVNLAHITDETAEQNRVVRFAILDVLISATLIVGSPVSPYLLYATDYLTIYLIILGLLGVSFLYTIFFISESLKSERKALPVKEILNSINIKEMVKYTTRKRENNARYYIFWIIWIYIIFALAMGETSVGTMFLRHKFDWTLKKLTLVGSISRLGHIFGTLSGTYILYKKLKFKEMPLCLFGLTLQIIANILRGIATNDYYIYTAIAINVFSGLPFLMLRTILSVMVAPQEIGKIFALISIITSVDEMLSSLMYPALYNATIDTNSGLYNFLSFGINLIAWIVIFILSRQKLPRYTAPQETEETKEHNGENRKISKSSVNSSSINDIRSVKEIIMDVDIRRLSQTPSLF